MFKSFLSRLALAVFAASISSQAFAFAVFVVPFTTPVTVGQTLLLGTVVPATLAQGVPLTWKKTSVPVTTAFAPNPGAPLTNGTTTWNQNAVSATNEWSAVGANVAFSPIAGAGNPCLIDGNIVAAFHPSLCLGILPPIALGITLLVGIVDSPSSRRLSAAGQSTRAPFYRIRLARSVCPRPRRRCWSRRALGRLEYGAIAPPSRPDPCWRGLRPGTGRRRLGNS